MVIYEMLMANVTENGQIATIEGTRYILETNYTAFYYGFIVALVIAFIFWICWIYETNKNKEDRDFKKYLQDSNNQESYIEWKLKEDIKPRGK